MRARPFDPLPLPLTVLLIAIGGGAGALARYLIGLAWSGDASGFPTTTLAVNVAGCFAMGALMTFIAEHAHPARWLRPLAGTGVLGGFTTFSTQEELAHSLIVAGHPLTASAYLAVTLLAALAAVWLGAAIGARVHEGIRR